MVTFKTILKVSYLVTAFPPREHFCAEVLRTFVIIPKQRQTRDFSITGFVPAFGEWKDLCVQRE
jgi:hypothetical protein